MDGQNGVFYGHQCVRNVSTRLLMRGELREVVFDGVARGRAARSDAQFDIN